MFFLNYLKSNINYKPINSEEEIPNDLVLVSNTCEQVWQKVKAGIKWEELPTDTFIVFPEDVKNWLDMYNYVNGLDTRGSKTESKLDENMEAYMLMCKREQKMLTFERQPSEIFQRMVELVPFIMKGKKSLDFKGSYLTIVISQDTKKDDTYQWTLKYQECFAAGKQWLINNKVCHVVQNPTSVYVGYGIVTKLVLNPDGYERFVKCTFLK